MKVLIIDDDEGLSAVFEAELQKNGFQTVASLNGKGGINKALSEKPDLILLDKIMPKMDGLEVCQRLKADPKTKDIPIIIISASGGMDLPQRCSSAGADDLITKPFEPGDLFAKIKALLKE